MAAYNAERTLGETLDSLLNQTFGDWEAVVVDDGSTDRTAAIARQYAERDARIRVTGRPNGGESAARNTGIQHAAYDWLLFLDSDDWISPSHLDAMTAELATDQTLDAVHCGSLRVAADGSYVSDDYYPPAGDLFPVLANRSAFPVHACIVRRCLVNDAGGLDTALKTCPDWDLWQRIARMGAKFGAVRQVLAYYRMTPHSSSLRGAQLLRDGITVLERGHAADPRIAKPVAEYANGMPPEEVQSQVFYLLGWNAGLVLGSGGDPLQLLEQVRSYRCTSLYPDAIAKCLFESGTLPLSRNREAWQDLFPALSGKINDFLVALELQSGTPGLAEAALQDLKLTILRHSPLWKPAVDGLERDLRRPIATLECELAERQRDLLRVQQENVDLRRDVEELRLRNDVLAVKFAAASAELSGLRKAVSESPLFTNASAAMPQLVDRVTIGAAWQLRVAEHAAAALRPTGRPGAVRVDIQTHDPAAPWNVQLNSYGLKLNAQRKSAFSFRARADRPRSIAFGVALAVHPWINLGLYQHFELTEKWETFEAEFTPAGEEEHARVHLDLGETDVAVEVSPLRILTAVEGNAVAV